MTTKLAMSWKTPTQRRKKKTTLSEWDLLTARAPLTGDTALKISRIAVRLGPGWALALGLALLCAPPGRAQNTTQLRTVHGVVEDKTETPVGSAVVYLENGRTLTVKTYISEDNGQYHFSGLDPNADYELHAEHDNLTSNTHTVSSFDSRKDFEVTLKLDREKKK
jgi:hypothetical protein